MTIRGRLSRAGLVALCSISAPAWSADQVLNLYSARHYQTDEALYSDFEKATGIKINRIEGVDDQLIERIRSEGANSPADVFLTVDAARLQYADMLDLFAPVKSAVLEQRIPANLRTPNWFAFSIRARLIVYNKMLAKKEDLQTYEDLANPRLKGKICTISGNYPYNLSLGAALLAHDGEAATEAWVKGFVANFARAPKGGDTDQLMSVGAGECAVTVSNSYYYARLMRSSNPKDRKVAESLAIVWPNQSTWGTHINVSGGGMLKNAPHKEAALKFLEYLASDSAQTYFADGNNEWPVVRTAKFKDPALKGLGEFKQDELPLGTIAKNVIQAQKIYDRAGFM
ncbi:extracellular solute-binding protein [Uliginosibacterium sp. sgz301328]|uniref:extracellular solute-binding protein n=1 Tax=Uliginosibacterium sp. sgz301328 TaxID=3243764 RepID=UPI00359D1634